MIWLMPFMPFEAIDSNGRTITGTLQVNNVQELESILGQKGLRLIRAGAPPASKPQPSGPVPAKPRPQAPVHQPVVRPQVPIQNSIPVRPISRETHSTRPTILNSTDPSNLVTARTPELTNKQKYLLFSQFASFVRSGFSSSQMIQHATSKMPPKVRSAFAEMEQETAGGMAMSDSMERRPMLFSPDQVAAVKAGEQSGQMEEAYNVIALQAERANAFRMTLGYFFIMFPILLLCGVGGIGIQKASQQTIQKQFDADGQLDKWGTLIAELKTRLPHEFLLSYILTGVFIGGLILFHKYPFRKFRHRAGLLIPMAIGRAKSEAVERFSWAMSAMLKGGASPASAVHIAAASIPNLVLRERALNAIGSTRENEPLGSVIQRSGILSPEYVHIIQNGELVGDTPGALGHIVKAEGDSFQASTGRLKTVGTITTLAIMALFTIAMVGFLYYMYASNLVKMFNNIQ
jgi:type II secretory pathway component PulF